MISRSGLMPAAWSAARRSAKKLPIPAQTAAGSVATLVAGPSRCTECMTTSRQLAAASSSYKLGLGKAADVVQVRRAAGNGKALDIRDKGVDRDRDVARGQLLNHRGQPPPLIICGNARCIRMAGRGPQFDHVGTLGPQPPGMRQRILSGQAAAAVGKGILGDVDNPDNARPARRDERGTQIRAHSRASSHSKNLIDWAAAVLDNTAAQIIG